MLRRPVFSPASTGIGVEPVAGAGDGVGEGDVAEAALARLRGLHACGRSARAARPARRRRSTLNSPCDICGISSVPSRGRISTTVNTNSATAEPMVLPGFASAQRIAPGY